jgi:glutamine amidotransferase-like uncharacterized protein
MSPRVTSVFVLFTVALAAACSRDARVAAPILLFNGTGASVNDVRAFETLLEEHGLEYDTADSARLDGLSGDELRAYRLLIVPGGNFEKMGNALDRATSARVRVAVNNGLNYLGVCAGAFFAGDSPYNGLDLTGGVRFPFYSASARGVRKAAVRISSPGFAPIDHYWEDGPQLSGWGHPVASYPDGTPAVVEGSAGRGWVVLVGTHPEAPESWRDDLEFSTPAHDSQAYAVRLIEAALAGRSVTKTP